MKKILVYSHDTFGLGNIRRMLEISRHLAETDPDVSVLIVSGSPMLHAFRIPSRVDYLKLPCLARSVQGDYHVKYLDLGYDQTIRLRANLIVSAVLDFAPDLILVDKKPCGVGNELAAALDLLQRRGNRPKTVLLLRDILDAPHETAQIWRKNGYHEAIEAFYDQVLVVGSQEVFDLTSEYDFPASSSRKVRYCGYLRRPPGQATRAQMRQQLGIGEAPLVFISAGGGEDGHHLLSSYVQGLRALAHPPAFKTLLICGPEMSETQRRQIVGAAAPLSHVEVREFSDDMMGCMDAADLVVAMGGYNTTCEILTLRKRAILVPRIRPVQEQWIRAERLDRLGLVRAIHPDALTPTGLLRAVQDELGRGNVYPSGLYQLDLEGLPRIADSVSQLLYNGPKPVAASRGREMVQ